MKPVYPGALARGSCREVKLRPDAGAPSTDLIDDIGLSIKTAWIARGLYYRVFEWEGGGLIYDVEISGPVFGGTVSW